MTKHTDILGDEQNSGLHASFHSLYQFKTQALILSLLAFVVYFNSFFNENAFDDQMVITQNEYVQEGVAGIPDILSKGSYYSYFQHKNSNEQLPGGRYRPLSIITFAIEQQFMGTSHVEQAVSPFKQDVTVKNSGPEHDQLVQQMHIRHVVNVLLYMVSIIVLLYFLRLIVFKGSPMAAFIAALIFTIHPIHTEVVANVKSRDEILSLLFICLTFIFEFKYRQSKNKWQLAVALGCFILALLSKEYAITLLVLLPLSLYVFDRYSIKKSLLAALPYFVITGMYALFRLQITDLNISRVESNIINNPYLLASPVQATATKISTLLNYIKLLLFPHPLSADYSYNSIPYKTFSNPIVWLSFTVHAALLVLMFMLIKKRHVIGFAIAFYLVFLTLVGNIFFNVGAPMGERLIYHSSVGFAIVFAWLTCRLFENSKRPVPARNLITAFIVLLILLSGGATIARNAAWKNDDALFTTDIKTVPDNIQVCYNAAVSYVKNADEITNEREKQQQLYDAIGMLNYCMSVDPTYFLAFLCKGAAWEKAGNIDLAKATLDSAKQMNPSYPALPGIYKHVSDEYMQQGWALYGKLGRYAEEIAEYLKAISIDSLNADKWYNLGGSYFHNKQYPEAMSAWQRCVRLKPDHIKGIQGINSLSGMSDSMRVQK